MELTDLIWYGMESVKIAEVSIFCRHFFSIKRNHAILLAVHNILFFLSNFAFTDNSVHSIPVLSAFLLTGVLYFSGNRQRQIFVIIAVYVIGISSEVLAASVLSIYNTGENKIIIPEARDMAAGAIALLLQTVFLYIASKPLCNKGGANLPVLYMLLMIEPPLASCIRVFCLFYWSIGQDSSTSVILVIIVFMVGRNYGNLYLYGRMLDCQRVRLLNKMWERQFNTYRDMMDIHADNEREARKVSHDMKHMITNIKIHLEIGDIEAAMRSVDDIQYMNDITCGPSKSENIYVDGILNYGIRKAEALGIKVSLDIRIPEEMCIDSRDISLLLGNAIDNAIEACSPLKDRERVISVHMRFHLRLLIKISNPYGGDIIAVPKNGIIPTTKGNADEHGIGMMSIREIVDRYDGDMTVDTKDNIFCLTIHLHEPDPIAPQSVRNTVLHN